MLDEQNAQGFATCQIDQDRADWRSLLLGQPGSRFVEEKNLGLQCQHHRKLKRPLLTMRKMPRFRRQLCIERRRHNDAHCSRGQSKTLIAPPEGGALKAETRQPQALGDRQRIEQAGCLKTAADAKRSDTVWRQPPDVGPVKEDRSSRTLRSTRETAHQSGRS